MYQDFEDIILSNPYFMTIPNNFSGIVICFYDYIITSVDISAMNNIPHSWDFNLPKKYGIEFEITHANMEFSNNK